MIVRSVFTVSCLSCGAPLALTYTLASWIDEPRADSLEISCFLPFFLGKMAVFAKTESLVMMLLCNAFTAANNTNALAAGSIADMSVQRVGTNVALCCCCMNMPSAGRAKFADCNVHKDSKVISKQLSKLWMPRLRRAAQGTVNCSRMTTTR